MYIYVCMCKCVCKCVYVFYRSIYSNYYFRFGLLISFTSLEHRDRGGIHFKERKEKKEKEEERKERKEKRNMP